MNIFEAAKNEYDKKLLVTKFDKCKKIRYLKL